MATPNKLPSLSTLNKYFAHNTKGDLIWRIKPKQSSTQVAGSISASGYIQVGIESKLYYAHRILYSLYHQVNIPASKVIDHRNHNKSDNRKSNLVLGSIRANALNRIKQAEHTNLYKRPNGKYTVYFQVKGKRRSFGTYNLCYALKHREVIKLKHKLV